MRKPKDSCQCLCRPATHAFCPDCETVRLVVFKATPRASANVLSFTKFEGGNLTCEACGAVVATLYRERQSSPRGKQPSLLRESLGE